MLNGSRTGNNSCYSFKYYCFLSIFAIICCVIWFILHGKSNLKKDHIKTSRLYRRSLKFSSTKIINKKNKRKLSTNTSSISLSFNPPHLINQNVKNLDKLLANEAIMKSLHYEDELSRCYTKPTIEPVYTSSSSISNLGTVLPSYPHNQQLNSIHFQFLNELNYSLCLKQEQKPRSLIRYSQSCRQTNDLIPFDYYHSKSPSINSNHEPISIRTNTTLMRKARLAQLRDDIAILY